MPVTESKPVEFNVEISESEPREVFFFDRFAVFRQQRLVELHFGFSGASPDPLCGLVIIVQRDVFDQVKKSFLDFVGVNGNVPETTELPAFKVRTQTKVLAADLIGLARHGALGEITFHALSWKVGIDLARSADTAGSLAVKGYFVALLRCELELQKRWVLAVYDSDEDKN